MYVFFINYEPITLLILYKLFYFLITYLLHYQIAHTPTHPLNKEAIEVGMNFIRR